MGCMKEIRCIIHFVGRKFISYVHWKRNVTTHNNFQDNIEPLKYVYVTSNGQTDRTKVYHVSMKTFYLILNLFETINEKEAIYRGENFGGQKNNITT